MARPRVLLLRGMNQLIFDRLREQLHDEVEFISAPIPVPLIGIGWLRDPCGIPSLLALIGGPVGVYWAFTISLEAGAVGAVVLFCLFHLLARWLVRGLLPEAMRVAASFDGGAVCSVGYSWGGGVLHHLVAERQWSGHALLLCPATTTMASFAGQEPPAPLTAAGGRRSPLAGKVAVVGARGDELCDATSMENFKKWGATTRMVNDDHAIVKEKSVQVVVDMLRRLIAQAQKD